MKDLVAIDQAGRMVLPKLIRKELQLDKGGVVKVQLVGNHVELTPISKPPRTLKKVGPFLVAESDGNAYDAVADINAVREERM
jgi:AbrB family looped-hinge helix DNA binding protein